MDYLIFLCNFAVEIWCSSKSECKIMGQYKLLPYGISDYAQVKREGLFMVDKTMYLERMERTGQFPNFYSI